MKKAFTLAEVLITLSILGVVVAIMMSIAVNNYQEQIRVLQLKKAYNDLKTSYQIAVAKHGTYNRWNITSTSGVSYGDDDSPADRVVTRSDDENRLASIMLNSLDYRVDNSNKYTIKHMGDNNRNYFGNESMPYVFKNGYTTRYPWIHACQDHNNIGVVCGDLLVDVNGDKGPNVIGKDVFMFYITNNSILPMGGAGDDYRSIESYCRKDSIARYNGYGCSAWVIEKGNMDYLKKDVSW